MLRTLLLHVTDVTEFSSYPEEQKQGLRAGDLPCV